MSPRSTASEGRLFSGSLALSVGLHAALAVLVLLAGHWRPPAPPPVLTVSLVAPPATRPGPGGSSASAGAPGAPAGPQPQPAATPAASLAQPAPPPTQPKPPKRHQVRPASVPRPQPHPQPRQALAPRPPRPEPRPAVEKAAPPAGASAPGPVATRSSGKASGTTAAGAGRLAGSGAARSAVLGYGQSGQGGGNPAAAQRHYLKLIRARILAQRKYPYMARQRRQEGVVRLRFTLSPAGALSQGVQVVKASGFNQLDEQAQQCVRAAAPFPPFPLDLRRPRLTIEVPVIYKISELER